jgi:hypothetical protein
MGNPTQPNDPSQGVNFDGPGGDNTPSNNVKMIPESDLLAVKTGLTKQLDDLKAAHATELSNLKQTADTNYQSMLGERARREELEKQLSDGKATLETLEALKKDVENKDTTIKSLTGRITTDLVGALVSGGFKKEELEGKSLQELDNLHSAMRVVKERSTGGYAVPGGGNGSGGSSVRSVIEKAKARTQ